MKLLRELLTEHAQLNERGQPGVVVYHSKKSGAILGGNKEFQALHKITKDDIVKAINEFKKTPEFTEVVKKLGKFLSNTRELNNGTLVFGIKRGAGSSYFIMSNGQLRQLGAGSGSWTRLKSPNPTDAFNAADTGVEKLVKIYTQSAKALLKKNLISTSPLIYSAKGLFVRAGLDKLPPGIPTHMNLFNCSQNQLKDLVGAPTSVEGMFDAMENELTNFKGAPLKSDVLRLSHNPITSCTGASNIETRQLILKNTKLTSLHGIEKLLSQCETIDFRSNTKVKMTHLLGLLKIKWLKTVLFNDEYLHLQSIIKKYLPEGDILDCQEELIEAGYEEQAQL
jgi:hypothetical protein